MRRFLALATLLASSAAVAQTAAQSETQFAVDAKAAVTAAQKSNVDWRAYGNCEYNYIEMQIAAKTPLPCLPPTVLSLTDLGNDDLAVAAAAANVFTDLVAIEQAQDQVSANLGTKEQADVNALTSAMSTLQQIITTLQSQVATLQTNNSALTSQVTALSSKISYLCSRKGSNCP